jgi:hypothetical protein
MVDITRGHIMRIREWISTAILAVVAAAYVVAFSHAQARSDAKAAAVIADMRKALGGDQKLAGIKSLSVRADYRREMSAMAGGGGTMTIMMMGGPGGAGGAAHGSQQTAGKIEIDLDFPDRYLKRDIGSAGFSMTRTEGFEGTRPFIEVVGNSPGMTVRADNPAADPERAKQALRRSNTELARLLIGLTGTPQPGFPVTFSYAGQAESPDGKADIVDAAGPEDFKLRLFVDVETHLPLMMTFLEPEPRMITRTMTRDQGSRGGGPVSVTAPGAGGSGAIPGLTPEQQAELDKQRKEAQAAPVKMIEQRLFFSDHRKVDGVSLPHRIARGTAEKTTEEWDITSYKLNPPFKADRFKVGS